MTQSKDEEAVTWHKADGTPTSDPKEATSAEVIKTLPDGSKEHTLMVKTPEGERRGWLDAG